ncbi:class I SAM-dependent methyltransferase [Hamadaea tsunoensis]|uniref:class I SAM-dependent methyltransferase n=1 Tax=Hamadaea tsunoensis TaxID=53368 RepID=UPI00048446FA|nr:class I SAM-dependent methyltransferase [Hamadaea tsunoensis]
MTTAFDEHERRQWAGRAEAYRRGFATLCAYPAGSLLDAAAVGDGVRVLDAGTGVGTVAALAVERGAIVTAVDAEPSMLDATRVRVPGADVRHAVLPDLPFEDGRFDAAVANFVVNHVGDPRAAVAALTRVVRPGGRVAVSVWPHPQPPLQRLWGEALTAAGVERPGDLPGVEAGKNFARTPDGLTGLLERGGLAGVSCTEVAWVHRTDPQDWWSGPANGLGAFGTLLLALPADRFRRVREAYEELVGRHLDDDGLLAMPTSALVAAGAKPE